ncbi:MAG: hypothetical protein LBU82_04510 [Treponema sp.]|nr:hypothetical protein [Treponema sp.]
MKRVWLYNLHFTGGRAAQRSFYGGWERVSIVLVKGADAPVSRAAA